MVKGWVEKYIKLAKDVDCPEDNDKYPESIRKSKALMAIYDNTGEDEKLALRIHKAVKKQALSGFRDNQVVVRRIKKALFEILGDDSEVERIYIHIEQPEDGVIAFDVITSCDVEMPSASHKGYFNERWLKIHCQVTLGIDMSGFRIMSVGNCEPQEESDNDRLSGELVPIISRDQFEDEAEKFLTRYCPAALDKPMRIPIETIASDMKLQVIEDVPLSDDLTYFGTIIFDKGYSYQSKYQGMKYYTQFMRNAAPVENQVEYSFELNTHNRTLLDQIQNAKRRSEALRKYPGSFAETLVALQKGRKLSNKQLADRSLVGEKTIQRLRNDEEYPTSVQTVLALCVGLKLPLPEAEMFLGKTDFKLNSLKGEGYIYQCVMGACAENSIYEINEMLKENGITPLGSDPDLQ